MITMSREHSDMASVRQFCDNNFSRNAEQYRRHQSNSQMNDNDDKLDGEMCDDDDDDDDDVDDE